MIRSCESIKAIAAAIHYRSLSNSSAALAKMNSDPAKAQMRPADLVIRAVSA